MNTCMLNDNILLNIISKIHPKLYDCSLLEACLVSSLLSWFLPFLAIIPQSSISTIPPPVCLFTRQSGWWLDTGHYGQSHETQRDGVNTFGGLRNICLVIQRASGQHGSKRQEWQNLQMLFEMKSVECSSSIIIR